MGGWVDGATGSEARQRATRSVKAGRRGAQRTDGRRGVVQCEEDAAGVRPDGTGDGGEGGSSSSSSSNGSSGSSVFSVLPYSKAQPVASPAAAGSAHGSGRLCVPCGRALLLPHVRWLGSEGRRGAPVGATSAAALGGTRLPSWAVGEEACELELTGWHKVR